MSVLVGGLTAQPVRADDDDAPGAVYTIGNASSGNALIVFNRGKDGGLTLAGSVDTGGLGTGSGLGSPGAIALGEENAIYTVTILVVTEKNTNKLDIFVIDRHGFAGGLLVQPSSGTEPFGFAFNKGGYLIPSEAFGGAAGASAASSYSVDHKTGKLHVVSASVGTLQTAACWISVTRNGRYVYSSNTGSGNVTGFSIDKSGALELLNPRGISGVTGGSTIDSAIVGNTFLYVLTNDATEHRIHGFEIVDDGSLEPVGSVGGLPTSAVGLAAL